MKPSTGGWALVVVYAALVAAGATRVMPRAPRWPATLRGHWRAARNLAPGDQLRADDVREPDDPVERVRLGSLDALVGQHLRVRRAAGEVVTPDDVGPWPDVPPPAAGRLQFVVRLGPVDAPIALAGTTDSAAPVYACYAAAGSSGEGPFVCPADSLTVRARHLSTPRDSAWVVVEGRKTPTLIALIGATHRVLVRSRPPSSPPTSRR